ncbi:MAG: SEC-C metal-binding domain-containing protein [Xanthobacteraceae bacterium]
MRSTDSFFHDRLQVCLSRCKNSPAAIGRFFIGGVPCASIATTTSPAFDVTSKRRKSFPSESHVKRGQRVVHGNAELIEKLGRNDLCPCGSGRRFQTLLHGVRPL